MTDIAENIRAIRGRMADAARRAGRDPAGTSRAPTVEHPAPAAAGPSDGEIAAAPC